MRPMAWTLHRCRPSWHCCDVATARRSVGLRSASTFGRASSPREALPKAQADRLLALEHDLALLDAECAVPTKKALDQVKRRWRLSAPVLGGTISLAQAREAVRSELRELVAEERALAAPPAPPASASGEAAQGSGRRAALGVAAATCAGAGFATWSFLAGSTPVRIPAGSGSSGAGGDRGGPVASVAAGSAAAATPGRGAGRAAATGREAVQAAGAEQAKGASPVPSSATAAPAASAAGESAGDAGSGVSARHYMLALACAGGLALGVWWLLQAKAQAACGLSTSVAPTNTEPPVGPEAGQAGQASAPSSDPLSISGDSPAGHAGRSSSTLDLGSSSAAQKAKSTVEEVFENTPEQGQTWDMSASIRGIQGGVQSRVSQFEGK